MTDHKDHTLIEIYKIHVELADRVSQRREGANRLYVTLLSALAVLIGIIARFGFGALNQEILLPFIGIMGSIISVSWWIVIRSYRQLNTGKFNMLHELEEKLPYNPFMREWQLLDEGKNIRIYAKLTTVESVLPIFFAVGFLFLTFYFAFPHTLSICNGTTP